GVGVTVVSYAAPVAGWKVGSQVRLSSPLQAVCANVCFDPTTERPSRAITRPSDCAGAAPTPVQVLFAPLPALRKRDIGATCCGLAAGWDAMAFCPFPEPVPAYGPGRGGGTGVPASPMGPWQAA